MNQSRLSSASKNEIKTHLEDILTSQRQAYLQEGAPLLQQRRLHLKKLKDAILSHRQMLEEAISSDFGHRSHHETSILETASLIEGIKYLQKNLRKFMKPTYRHVTLKIGFGKARIEYQPMGVVGIMSPWNYPLSLPIMPVATAIAAGNRVMLKPSEFTPKTNALLKEMLEEIFTIERVSVITGEAQVGALFSALPFDHLLFTGSTPIGRNVMKAASENLVPVTLELGGKSPVIISRGQTNESYVASIVFGKLVNSGQTCIAPDYAFVHENEIESFIELYDKIAKKFYPEGPCGKDYTSIINEKHFSRLNALIADAKSKGANIIEIGHKLSHESNCSKTMGPTVIQGMTDEMQIAQEEIFGPILPLISYQEIEEVISYINSRPRPLALYYFGPDDDNRSNILNRTTSGNVAINTTVLHYAQNDLPFGGVGASGMGAYHGVEGFRTFSHAKGIFDQSRWNISKLVHPPYTRTVNWILKFILR